MYNINYCLYYNSGELYKFGTLVSDELWELKRQMRVFKFNQFNDELDVVFDNVILQITPVEYDKEF